MRIIETAVPQKHLVNKLKRRPLRSTLWASALPEYILRRRYARRREQTRLHTFSARPIIDLPFVCSYNTNMLLKFGGFFRPDHDPPQNGFLRLLF